MALNQYKAFISYSHKDRRWASWLHRKLETYSFPSKILDAHPHVPANLKPIFRDREDLSAGHNLGEKIEAALQKSENLITICSPNAAASHWVNQEILFFKRNNRGANIYAVIVDGDPFADDADMECLPQALRYEIDQDGNLTDNPAEPLAADLREIGDGKRLGLLKLISGIVVLGLDDIVQRDLQRARRRVTAITVSAATIVLVMGGLTWKAVNASQAAEIAQQEAEKRRNDAEGQIEFMLTDLKEKLEGVGRLDALEAVGQRAAEYYENYPISDHDDDALGRRARVFHYLGEIQDKYGNLAEAEKYFQSAYDATEALVSRNPNNPDRVFEHSQSAFWLGNLFFSRADFSKAEPHLRTYLELANRLTELEPEKLRSLQESTYAHTNIAVLYTNTGRKRIALEMLEKSIPIYLQILKIRPQDPQKHINLAQTYAWLADASEPDFDSALSYRELELSALERALQMDEENSELIQSHLSAKAGKARVQIASRDHINAAETINSGLKTTLSLANKDDKNVKWLESQALFKLLSAENNLALGAVEEGEELLGEYDILKTRIKSNPNYTSSFFDRQAEREARVSNKISSHQLLNVNE